MDNPIPIQMSVVIDINDSSSVKGIITSTGELIEPFGENSFSEILENFKAQAKERKENGASYFIIDKMQTLSEIRAAVIACKKQKLPIYVTITVDELGFTPLNSPALAQLICLQALGIAGFGINCSDEPTKALDLLSVLAPFAKIPLIANFSETEPAEIVDLEDMIVGSHARIIIANFDGHSMQKKALSDFIEEYDYSINPVKIQDTSLILANESQVFFLSADGIESSDPLPCYVDMADELINNSDTNMDLITIEVLSADDAYYFSQNAHMARLPIMFKSDNELALKTALLTYHGKAMIDSNCEIPHDILVKIADKYGAVLY